MENTPKSTVPSLVAGLTMVASAIVLKVFQFPLEIRIIISLIPVIPTSILIWSMAKAIGHLDEMQQKIQLEGLSLAFAGTLIITIMCGMLQVAKVTLPSFSMLYVYGFMVILYSVGTFLAGRKYK